MNKENYDVPGPGHYEIKDISQNGMSGCKSSFSTKDTRQGYITKNNTPGPGCYNGDSPKLDKKKEERDEMKDELFNRLQKKEKK